MCADGRLDDAWNDVAYECATTLFLLVQVECCLQFMRDWRQGILMDSPLRRQPLGGRIRNNFKFSPKLGNIFRSGNQLFRRPELEIVVVVVVILCNPRNRYRH